MQHNKQYKKYNVINEMQNNKMPYNTMRHNTMQPIVTQHKVSTIDYLSYASLPYITAVSAHQLDQGIIPRSRTGTKFFRAVISSRRRRKPVKQTSSVRTARSSPSSNANGGRWMDGEKKEWFTVIFHRRPLVGASFEEISGRSHADD